MIVMTYKKLEVVTMIVTCALVIVSVVIANWILTLSAVIAVITIFIILT
jgi:hypothetical protein